MEPEETFDSNTTESTTDTQFPCVSRTRDLVATSTTRSWVKGAPYIRIIEQPHPTQYRFRYESEGRLAGSIPGINSTDSNKSFPTIEVVNFKDYIEILVSCVTVEEPHLQHPHNLVSKKNSKYGVYCMQLKGHPMQATLSNVGIRCVRRDEIAKSIKQRTKINFDPFGGGFKEEYPFNLSAVRLCYQGFIPTGPGTYHKLPPVVSEPITDKKHVYKLEIVGLCSCSDKAVGGAQIYMFCSPLPSADVKIRFYEEIDGKTVWESNAKFTKVDIHLKCGIRFKTPPYRNLDIEQPVKVFVQLERLSTETSTSAQAPTPHEYSQPLQFEYYPDPERIKRLRLKRGNAEWERLQSRMTDRVQTTVNFNNAFGASNREQCRGLEIQSTLNLNIPAEVMQREENVNESHAYNDDDSMTSIPSESVTFDSDNLWNSESLQQVMYMWNSRNVKPSQQPTLSPQYQHTLQQHTPSRSQLQSPSQQPIMHQQHFQSQQLQTPQVYHHTSTLKTLSLSDELEDIFDESRQRLQQLEPNCRYSAQNLHTIQENRNQFTFQPESNQHHQTLHSSQQLYQDHEQGTPQETLQQCTLNQIQGQTLQRPQMDESQQRLPAFQHLKDPMQRQHQFYQNMQHPQFDQQLPVQNYQYGQM